MNIKYIRNFFIIFVISLMFYASYIIIYNDITLKNETVSKSLIISENEKITHLKLGISEFDTFNPIMTQNKEVQYISRLVYDSLFTISKDYKIENCLAVECSKISNTSYIIKLRENVYWTSNEEFTAEDVKYTIEKIKTEEGIYKELVKPIKEIQIIDKYTIKINLSEESTFFEYNLIFPIIKSNSTYEDSNNIGRYNIQEIDENKIVLKLNDKWWNKPENEAILENITIYLYSNKLDEFKAFKRAEIDMVNTNNIKYEDYVGQYGYNEEDYICPKHTILAFNMENEFLANTDIRQAISKAIDKENIVSTVFDGKYNSSNFPLEYGSFLYDNSYEHIYNPKNANNILRKQFNDFEVSLDFIVKNTENEKIKVAEIIKSDLENIGIIVNILILDESEYIRRLNSKEYDMFLSTIDMSLNPSLEILLGDGNLLGYNNTEVFQIIEDIKNIKDEKILIEKYKELQKHYFNDIPCISLYNEVNRILYSKNLRAILSPNYFNLFYGIEKWYLVKNTSFLG